MTDYHGILIELSIDLIAAINRNGYGKIISVESYQDGDVYREQIEVDFSVPELPQYPVIKVDPIEKIRIRIAKDELPVVLCRDDFPIVPHLNVHQNGEKSLCLFDVPYQDVKYMFNGSMFLNRIAIWFTKTSRSELHQPDQPLEPFFPSVSDVIILNASRGEIPYFIRLEKIRTKPYTIFSEISLKDIRKGQIYAVLYVEIDKIFSENIIRKQPQHLYELDDAFDVDITTKLESCVQPIWSIKQNVKMYMDLFKQKENELKNCNLILLVNVSLARKPGLKPERHEIRAFTVESNFQNMYNAFGYKKENSKLVKKHAATDLQQIKISQFEVICNLERTAAQKLNDLEDHCCDQTYFQIGVGTLGSQIIENCIRAGYGKWTFIDSDILYPHNLARHCLTSEYIGSSKVEAMKLYSEKILSDKVNTCVQGYIQESIFDNEQREYIIQAITNSNMVIDTSASIAVERYLCHELARKTRCVCFFMNPSGSSAIMLLEDKNRTVTLDMLEMQYYSLLISDEKYKDHLISEERVVYSTNCRGISAKIPQDNVAMFSALCSKAIKYAANNPEAHVVIWSLDGLSLNDSFLYADGFEHYMDGEWIVKVAASVKERLLSLRMQKLPDETGGVLVGSYDHERKICYVVEIISSPDDSIESPNSYIRGSKGLLQRIKEIEDVTVNNLYYIGEWHSHPNNNTMQSINDKTLMRTIADHNAQQCCPGCMIIVGEDHISLYLQDSSK